MPPSTSDWDPKNVWAPYAPDGKAPWNLRRVVHLHRRAGFGVTWGDIQRDLKDGPEASLDHILTGGEARRSSSRPARTRIWAT